MDTISQVRDVERVRRTGALFDYRGSGRQRELLTKLAGFGTNSLRSKRTLSQYVERARDRKSGTIG